VIFPIIFGGLLAGPLLLAAARETTKATAKTPQGGAIRAMAPAELTAVKSTGVRQAPITIEVFSDYQCPQCRIFFQETFHQLMDDYIPAGKVYYVHRDFPLPMHSHSRDAARWATAVAMIGHEQFAAVEQVLYAKQDDWGSTGRVEDTIAGVLSPADMKKVRLIESTQGPAIDAAIASDIALGNSRGVNGTPSIYVFHSGQMTPLPPGGVSYSLLKQYLDYLLQH
jgi:protein-disulfide isomerase